MKQKKIKTKKYTFQHQTKAQLSLRDLVTNKGNCSYIIPTSTSTSKFNWPSNIVHQKNNVSKSDIFLLIIYSKFCHLKVHIWLPLSGLKPHFCLLHLCLTWKLKVVLWEYQGKIWHQNNQKTIIIRLPHGEETIVVTQADRLQWLRPQYA